MKRDSRGSYLLLGLQILAHLSILPMVFYAGLREYLIAFGVYFLTGCIGMSITYHRLLSHGSFHTPEWFRRLGVLLATLGLTGSALSWVAVHRQHHHHTDRPRDPHSPLYRSFFKVQFFSMFFRPKLTYVRDLIGDPFLKSMHRHYLFINLTYAAVLVLVDPFAVIYAHLFPAAILWNAGSAINTLGHSWGYRRFVTRDKSANNPLLGVFMWGEGWHNNHHRYPRAANFSRKWYEIDIGAWIIHAVRTDRLNKSQGR